MNNINSFQEGENNYIPNYSPNEENDYKEMIPPLGQNQGDFSGIAAAFSDKLSDNAKNFTDQYREEAFHK